MSARRYYNEATLADLAGELWRGRVYMLLGGLAGLILAVLFLAMAVPHYRAVMIVGPVAAQANPEAESPADPLGFARFESILRAPRVAARIAGQEEMAQGLQQARRWRTGKAAAYSSPEKLAAYFEKNIQIAPVGNTLLRRVSYDHPDPRFAAALLDALYRAADGLIHEESRDYAAVRAAQLRETLAQARNPEHRRALTDALMAQEQAQMLLSLDEPYAAFIVEPPTGTPRPWWPRAPLIVAALTALGLFAGFAAYSLRAAERVA